MESNIRFRVYLHGKMDGPYSVKELCELPDFSMNTLVCLDGEIEWIGAGQIPDITRVMQHVSSGDYNPDLVKPEEPKTVDSTNWRRGIVVFVSNLITFSTRKKPETS